VFTLCLPAAVGLAVLAPQLIGLVYQHGRFGSHDTEMAAQALTAYAIGLAGYANIKVMVPAFYALGDARTPAGISCLSILVNAFFNWIAIYRLGFGHAGLAMVTSLTALLNFGLLLVLLRRRIGRFAGLGQAFGRIALASVVVGVVCVATKWGVAAWFPLDSNVGRAVVALVAIPLGVAAFAGSALALGLDEVKSLLARARRSGWR
jgi:putative peptidoglycan lipid II flippase